MSSNKRKRAAIETKNKIIEAVRKLLKEKEADKITIEEITKTAGVAKGTFYVYFKRKEDVISELLYEKFDGLAEETKNSDADVYRRLKTFLIESVKIIEETTLPIAQNWMKYSVAPKRGENLGEKKYEFDLTFITSCLRDAIKREELSPTTPVDKLAREIVCQYYGIVSIWCLTNGKVSISEQMKFFCSSDLKAILKTYAEDKVEYITLNDGSKIPQIGFGTFQIPNDGSTYEAVKEALKAGYRHIDTAAAYFNEDEVGRAVADSGIPREDIFITSKIWLQDHGYEEAKKGIKRSLDKLGTYIDLYLIHQPYGDVVGTWKALEEAVEKGDIKSIGVSNMTPKKWNEFVPQFQTKPAVNQVEYNPYFRQSELKEITDRDGVVIEAWGPLGQGNPELLKEPVLLELAEKYNKDPGQIIIRSQIQDGVITLPRSTNPKRIASNLDIFDFELTEEEMDRIKSLDKGVGTHNPDAPGVGEMLKNAFVIED